MTIRFKKKEMLTSALRILVKNLIKESFDITFMGNEKKNVKTLIAFFSSPIKIFFNGILNQNPKSTR